MAQGTSMGRGQRARLFLGRVIYALAWVPYQIYCFLLFLSTLITERREIRRFQFSDKHVEFVPLSNQRVTLDDALELIEKHAESVPPREGETRWPAYIRVLQELLRRTRTERWKLGSVEEFREIPVDEFRESIARTALVLLPERHIFVWATLERTHLYVVYNPFTGKIYGELPESALTTDEDFAHLGDKHFVYALRVTPKDT